MIARGRLIGLRALIGGALFPLMPFIGIEDVQPLVHYEMRCYVKYATSALCHIAM